MKKAKSLEYKKRLPAVFASFTILIMGAMSLLESMSLDYYSVVGTLGKVIPASAVMAAIGWVMGFVLDQPRRGPKLGYTNMFVKDIMSKDLTDTGEDSEEKKEDEDEDDEDI